MEVFQVCLGLRNLTEVFIEKLILKKVFVNKKLSWIPPASLFLYPLKTLENQRFSDVFRGFIKRPVA